eukprot:COSAG04_NODE_16706_length_491_cov_1.410714_2_plen_48_part_01
MAQPAPRLLLWLAVALAAAERAGAGGRFAGELGDLVAAAAPSGAMETE